MGPAVEQFEFEFASFCGVDHCIGVGNGTDALELALRGAGISEGDEVITVANAGMYASTAILAVGAKPVYADVIEENLTMDPESVVANVSLHTRCILCTHLYGQMADVKTLKKIADNKNLF